VGTATGGQPRQKVTRCPFQTIVGCGTWKITVPGQPGQKTLWTPSKWKKVGCSGVHLHFSDGRKHKITGLQSRPARAKSEILAPK
jgi:hypothetical protein